MGESDRVVHPPRVALWAALWLGVGLVAALLRLYELGAAPLAPAEAVEAVASLAGPAALGAPGGPTSALVASLNRVLFWLLGSGDSLARLVPAALGSLLPLVLWLLVAPLGQRTAWLGAAILAISPSLVFFSRTVAGVVPGLTAALLLLAALRRWHQAGGDRWWLVAAVASGLGVAAGGAFLSTVLALALAALVARPAELRWPGRGTDVWRGVLVAGGTAVLASTAFLFTPSGLGVLADGLVTWMTGFGLSWAGIVRLVSLLLVYEPLAVGLGLAGLVQSVRVGGGWRRLLVTWALFGLLVAALRPDQPDGPFLLLLPLALLAGLGLDSALSQPLSRSQERPLASGTAAILVLLGAHILLSLGQYGRYAVSRPERAQASLLLVGIATILVIGVAALAWTYSRQAAIRGLTLALTALLVLYGWGKAWELGHTHQADPRELWVEEATGPGARLLVETLRTASERATRSTYTLPVTVQAEPADPVLSWYLRDFPLTWVALLQPTIDSEAVVTPVEQQSPQLGSNYMGMDLALRMGAPPPADPPVAGAGLRWLLLRDAAGPVPTQEVVVWIRQDIALARTSGW